MDGVMERGVVGSNLTYEPVFVLNLDVLCRQDAGNSNLRSAAFEALMDLIKYSAKVGVG